MQFLADVFVPCEQCDGEALQAAGARGAVPREERAPGARHDGARGADVLQHVPESAPAAAGARRDRPRIPAPRPARDDAVGRRGAANQDRGAPDVAERRAAALRSRRADDRTALRRHREAAGRVPETARGRALAPRDRAQPRRHQDGRLGHRSRPRGRRSRRGSGGGWHTRAGGAAPASHTGRYLQQVLEAARAHAYAGRHDD